ncbi:FecR domain-containing protein [Salicola sp. Rm-C-2C1-2]|uniref:FecR domain-containing protein n=1 Tax=Salicola sp. Rm-C-2C1-2 TaxID=3141321 RepID=UPI0032E520F0
MPVYGDVARGSDNAQLSLAPAPVESWGDWTYTIKPDDTPAAIADRFLTQRRNAAQLMGYNGRAQDAALEPGETLQVPVQWLQHRPKPATTTSVRGKAWRTSHPEGSRNRLNEGDTLNVGDGVRTASDGYARIELADGATLAIEPDSRLRFNRLTQYGQGAMADTRLRLERGRIETRVEEGSREDGSRFEIHTPSAVAAVRGTRFGLESREDGTLLEVRKGEVWFGTPQDAEAIREGYSAFLSTDAGAEPVIKPLPPAPRITSGTAAAQQLPVNVAWEAPREVARFRLDLYRRDGNWVASETVSGNSHSFAGLTNGDYRLRLTSLRDDRQGGTDTLKFEIGLQARPALLQKPARDATLEDSQPHFEWSLQGDSEQARVEVARSPQFEKSVAASAWETSESAHLSEPLEPGRYCWRVATRAGGDTTATSAVNCFQLAGKLEATRVISANTIDDRVNLYWQSVDNAQGYRLQLARDSDFEQIVEDREVSANEVRLRLTPGERYHVRVKGLAGEPMRSNWGEVREIAVE